MTLVHSRTVRGADGNLLPATHVRIEHDGMDCNAPSPVDWSRHNVTSTFLKDIMSALHVGMPNTAASSAG